MISNLISTDHAFQVLLTNSETDRTVVAWFGVNDRIRNPIYEDLYYYHLIMTTGIVCFSVKITIRDRNNYNCHRDLPIATLHKSPRQV